MTERVIIRDPLKGYNTPDTTKAAFEVAEHNGKDELYYYWSTTDYSLRKELRWYEQRKPFKPTADKPFDTRRNTGFSFFKDEWTAEDEKAHFNTILEKCVSDAYGLKLVKEYGYTNLKNSAGEEFICATSSGSGTVN